MIFVKRTSGIKRTVVALSVVSLLAASDAFGAGVSVGASAGHGGVSVGASVGGVGVGVGVGVGASNGVGASASVGATAGSAASASAGVGATAGDGGVGATAGVGASAGNGVGASVGVGANASSNGVEANATVGATAGVDAAADGNAVSPSASIGTSAAASPLGFSTAEIAAGLHSREGRLWRALLKRRCPDIVSRPGRYDADLVQLCRIVAQGRQKASCRVAHSFDFNARRQAVTIWRSANFGLRAARATTMPVIPSPTHSGAQ